MGVDVGERRYLELAEFWIENRGNHQGRASMEAYDQDDKSVFDQPALEGHAVRAGLLAAGIALAAGVNHRPDYYATARRWWDNMVEAKMYVTGGLGAIPTFEGFGADYELPNDGYAETCAAVGGAFFSQNLGLVMGSAEYFDILERELFNGALSGVSLAGDSYFYTNYLASTPDRRRWSWNGCPCCPPMFLKLMSSLSGSIYATDAGGVYVNQFVGSRAEIAQDGLDLTLTQKTGYPWNGGVRLDVSPRKPSHFAVSLRIPGWSRNASYRLNGRPIDPQIARGYARFERTWHPGDVVEVDMPMPVTRVRADRRVTADVGRVALMRGPVVYCLEGLDNHGRIDALVIPPSTEIRAEHRPDLLGGVTTLHGDAQRVRPSGDVENVSFTAVPFYANTNREPTDMAVWIAERRDVASTPTLAGESTPSASHRNASDTVWALGNGQSPRASDDDSIPRFTWWDHQGTAEWVQYDFPQTETVDAVDVYWWDESRVHRDCRVPQSWVVEYRDGDEWLLVQAIGDYPTAMDVFNCVKFAPVNTTGLRITVQLQAGWSAGILQWRVSTAGSA